MGKIRMAPVGRKCPKLPKKPIFFIMSIADILIGRIANDPQDGRFPCRCTHRSSRQR